MPNNRKLIRYLGTILTLLLLIFAFIYIRDLFFKVEPEEISEVNMMLIGLSVIFFVCYYLLHSIHWLLATRLTEKTEYTQSFSFFASQPYKYLPSSIFTFSYRAVYSRKLGLSFRKSSISQVYENISMLSANLSVFIAAYLLYIKTIFGLFAFASIFIASLLLYLKKNLHIKIKSKKVKIKTSHLLAMYYLSFVAWCSCGISFYILNSALGLSGNFLLLIAANSIAFSLSILAVFAPGGIGVREAVYSFFSIAAVTVISWRILVFVMDFLVGIVSIFLIKKAKTK